MNSSDQSAPCFKSSDSLRAFLCILTEPGRRESQAFDNNVRLPTSCRGAKSNPCQGPKTSQENNQRAVGSRNSLANPQLKYQPPKTLLRSYSDLPIHSTYSLSNMLCVTPSTNHIILELPSWAYSFSYRKPLWEEKDLIHQVAPSQESPYPAGVTLTADWQKKPLVSVTLAFERTERSGAVSLPKALGSQLPDKNWTGCIWLPQKNPQEWLSLLLPPVWTKGILAPRADQQ